MPRPRKNGRKGWPDNLTKYTDKRTGKEYYSYWHPIEKMRVGLGTDREAAFKAAKDFNAFLATQEMGALTKRLMKVKSNRITVANFNTIFEQSLTKRGLKNATMRVKLNYLKRTQGWLGPDKPMDQVSTRDIMEIVESFEEQDQLRSAAAVRSFLLDYFREAEALGYIPRGTNPVEVTRMPRAKVKRMRLTLPVYKDVLAKAEEFLDPFASNSQLLALVTGQRPEDIAEMQFLHIHEGRWLRVKQQKTGSLVQIDLQLKMDALGLSVGDVIERCRDTTLSRYIIHHTKRRTKSKPGDAVHPQTISKGFLRARRMVDLKVPDRKTPPTFYEIRSLAERTYDEQGGVNTRALLGHKDIRSTAIYKDRRGDEWMVVEA